MKKLLALVLALVMTLSLCVVSSNAKFDDAADFSYGEAIDVMSAAGVFVGDGSGKFDAKANLTRAQAAKIIAYLDLGESVAESLPAVQMFSDVPATHWAAKYIAYCADGEIVNGVGDGKFAPDAQVTGYQFAKMLLVVLGYDVEIEKLTGMNWSISTAKLAKEDKLTKGFKGNMNNGLTREEAAQLAFRAIQATPVASYTGYGLKVDNGMVVTNSNGKAVKCEPYKFYKANGALEKTVAVQLKDQLWHSGNKAELGGDLTKVTANDNLANPAHKWVWKNAKVGTYTDAPVLTYTTEWTWAQAKEDLSAAGVEIDTVSNNFTQNVTMVHNGYSVAADTLVPETLKKLVKDNKKLGGNGVVTKFYDDDGYLYLVTEAQYELAEVTSVVEDKASTKLVNESALKFGDSYKADEDTIGFAAAYANAKKGDYLLIAKVDASIVGHPVDSEFVLDVVVPATAEGKLTFVGTKNCKLDGVSYPAAKNAKNPIGKASNSDTVTLFLDAYGYAYGSDVGFVDDKTCVVLENFWTVEGGKGVEKVSVVYANGTTGALKVNGEYAEGFLYTYQKGNNGVYTLNLATETDTVKIATTAAKIKAGAARIGSYFVADDVTVVYTYKTNDTYKVAVDTEIKEIADGIEIVYLLNDDTQISNIYVFNKAKNVLKTTDGLVFLANLTYENGEADDVDGNTQNVSGYDAYKNGDAFDFVTADAGGVGNEGCFYKIELDSEIDGAYVLNGNHYVAEPGDDIQTVENCVLTNTKATEKGDVLYFTDENGDATLKVDGSTIWVVTDKDTTYDIDSFNDLDECLKDDTVTTGYHNEVKFSAVYDDDSSVISYIYITKVAVEVNN